MVQPIPMKRPPFDWNHITHVLLDLDGTLLDKDFDDRLWEELVPRAYARKNQIPLDRAKALLFRSYREERGTLKWYDVYHWSTLFGLDLVPLQRHAAHAIAMHPGVEPFLEFARSLGKSLHLLTNAHPETLDTKLRHCPLSPYFDGILSAFDVGYAKEQSGFWEKARFRLGFEPETSVLVDDNVDVLAAARQYGVRYVLHKTRSSLTRAPEQDPRFYSLEFFSELMEPRKEIEHGVRAR